MSAIAAVMFAIGVLAFTSWKAAEADELCIPGPTYVECMREQQMRQRQEQIEQQQQRQQQLREQQMRAQQQQEEQRQRAQQLQQQQQQQQQQRPVTTVGRPPEATPPSPGQTRTAGRGHPPSRDPARFNHGMAALSQHNYGEAFAVFMALARLGDAVAEYELAQMYENGWGMPQDYSEAIPYLEQSADAGDADAAYDLANLYQNGEGVAADPVTAQQWQQKAAALGADQSQSAPDTVTASAEPGSPSSLGDQRMALSLSFGASLQQLFPQAHYNYATMPIAGEYHQDEIRYLMAFIVNDSPWRDFLAVNGCMSPQSYVVFMFNQRRLFRVSVRLYQDASCSDYQGAIAALQGIGGPPPTSMHQAGSYIVFEFIQPGMANPDGDYWSG